MNCIFCKIVKQELPASIVYEDASVLAFLDLHPVNPGHTLVVPKRHVESFTDLKEEEVSEIFQTGQKIAAHIKTTIGGCEGINLSLADGEKAGQEVPHAHLHIIPRFSNDGFGWKFPKNYSQKPCDRNELDQVASKLSESIKRNS